MKLVAGLGNPGDRYRRTRHNVGFEVADAVAARHEARFEMGSEEALQARWRLEGDVVLIVKPLSFMNVSGAPVSALARYYKIDLADVLIVCDDVNLPLGRLRGRASGSEGGHNGLRSIAEAFGTTDYARLRIGVGRGDARRDLADHVLARFDAEEAGEVQAMIGRAAEAVELWVDKGLAAMMNLYNRDV